MIKTRVRGSVQRLVRKCAESENLPVMADFKVIWPRRALSENCSLLETDNVREQIS